MAAPNLNDPAERAAYRRELQGVARGPRHVGVGLAMLGAALAVVRALYWRAMPEWIPALVIGVAFAAMAVGIVARTRYHARRMRGG